MPGNEAPTKRKLRPQQDVVFQLGFLLGKLGKDNVLVFFRECDGFEVLSFEGVKITALTTATAGNFPSSENSPTAGLVSTLTGS